MTKYIVIESRKFIGGSLKGLAVEQKLTDQIFKNKQLAAEAALGRLGFTGGGAGMGSPYIVVSVGIKAV